MFHEKKKEWLINVIYNILVFIVNICLLIMLIYVKWNDTTVLVYVETLTKFNKSCKSIVYDYFHISVISELVQYIKSRCKVLPKVQLIK